MPTRFSRRKILSGVALGAGVAACGPRAMSAFGKDPADVQSGAPGKGYEGPLYLSDTTVLQPNAVQQTDNVKALENPTGQPMLIDGIDFGVDVLYGGGVVGCALSLGKIPLTKDHVPIWLFSPALPGAFADSVAGTSLGQDASKVIHRWDFDRPLFVPAGATLVPSFQHRGLGGAGTSITVSIGYRCRVIPNRRMPAEIEVPWATSWLAPPLRLAAVGVDEVTPNVSSTPTDLANPDDVPMDVRRFTGRFFAVFANANALGVTNPFIDEIITDSFISGVDLDATMRMTSSWDGAGVIPFTSAFRTIFDPHTRSWEIPHVLPARGFYTAYLNYGGMSLSSPLAVYDGLGSARQAVQAHIGMIGTRKVKFDGKVT